jgi:hypothetical protein
VGRVGSTEYVTSGRRWHRRIPCSFTDSTRPFPILPEVGGSMKRILSRFLMIAALALVAQGCALSLRNPDIADLQRHPGRYTDRTVSVSGVVTSSWGVPLVPFRFYKVDDGTGEVTVLSQSSRMPGKGERVRVRGRVQDVAVLGGRAVGLHIREEDLHVKR